MRGKRAKAIRRKARVIMAHGMRYTEHIVDKEERKFLTGKQITTPDGKTKPEVQIYTHISRNLNPKCGRAIAKRLKNVWKKGAWK